MEKHFSQRRKLPMKRLNWLTTTRRLIFLQFHSKHLIFALFRYLSRRKFNCPNYTSLVLLTFFITVSVSSPTGQNVGDTVGSVRHTRNDNSSIGEGAHGMALKPEHFIIPIGGVIHLFPRYGYLSLSMKVISKTDVVKGQPPPGSPPKQNEVPPSHGHAQSSSTALSRNDSWIFLEPVNNVIEPSTMEIEEASITPSSTNDSLPFHNLFHIDLCEDMSELLEAYFKNFSIEGLDKPWQAFSGGWRVPSIARYFGIDQSYVEGDYKYILVKVLLVQGSGTVVPFTNITVSSTYKPNFSRFKSDNELSTYEFFKVVGTHYIHAYILGNALYQVFVYDPDGFHDVKRRLFYDGIKDQSTADFMDHLPETLSQWVKHSGRVFVLSSPPEVLESVRKALVKHNSTQTGPSLFNLHNNPRLVKRIETLLGNQPNGVLGIDLRGIHFLFTDAEQRAGFTKALKHKMQLWEINFAY